MERNHNAIK